jgi:type VII secretion protein EccB
VKSGFDHFLVYDGKRAEIDVDDPAIMRALGLEGAQARPISIGFLNSIPEVPRIEAPRIRQLGSAPRFPLQNKTVGSVVQVSVGADPQYYVVLENGIQKIGAALAQLIYFSDSQGATGIASVTPDAISRIPSVSELAVDLLPRVVPEIVDDHGAPVGCLEWAPSPAVEGGESSSATLKLVAGLQVPIPEGGKLVSLAQADGSGDNLDNVHVEQGFGGFVQATGIETNSTRHDGVFYVADTGVKYGVPDETSARALGLTRTPDRAPWQMLDLLASGPALEKSNALIAHDGIAPDTAPAAPVN